MKTFFKAFIFSLTIFSLLYWLVDARSNALCAAQKKTQKHHKSTNKDTKIDEFIDEYIVTTDALFKILNRIGVICDELEVRIQELERKVDYQNRIKYSAYEEEGWESG